MHTLRKTAHTQSPRSLQCVRLYHLSVPLVWTVVPSDCTQTENVATQSKGSSHTSCEVFVLLHDTDCKSCQLSASQQHPSVWAASLQQGNMYTNARIWYVLTVLTCLPAYKVLVKEKCQVACMHRAVLLHGKGHCNAMRYL